MNNLNNKAHRTKAKVAIVVGSLMVLVGGWIFWLLGQRVLDDYQFIHQTIVTKGVIHTLKPAPNAHYPGDQRLIVQYQDGVKTRRKTLPCWNCEGEKASLCCGAVGDSVLIRHFDQSALSDAIISPWRVRGSEDGSAGDYRHVNSASIFAFLYFFGGIFIIIVAVRVIRRKTES